MCKNNPEVAKKYYQEHHAEITSNQRLLHKEKYKNPEWKNIVLARNKKWRENLRLEVLTHYSDNTLKCFCCGENIIQFLTIDHINNNGSEHRKQIGTTIYRWLKKNHFPKGYRVLCYNCNCAIGHYGVCPHDGTTTETI